MRMLEIAALGLVGGQSLEFEPGGYHLMLYEPDFGDAATLVLRFYLGDGAVVRARAALRPPEAVRPGRGSRGR